MALPRIEELEFTRLVWFSDQATMSPIFMFSCSNYLVHSENETSATV